MLILNLLISSISMLAHADSCTLEKVILLPASQNTCYEKLIEHTQNAEDKKWLLNMRSQWNPPKNMMIKGVYGGLEVFLGAKHIGGFQWLSLNPRVLLWNGQIKTLRSEASASVTRSLADLLDAAPISGPLWRTLLPEAYAETGAESKLLRGAIALFELGGGPPKSILEAIRGNTVDDSSTADFLPTLKYLQMSVRVDCNKTGAQKVPYRNEYDKRDYTVSQISPYEFKVEGFGRSSIGPKTIVVEYHPVQEGGARCLSDSPSDIGFVRNTCNPAWEAYLKQDPSIANSDHYDTIRKNFFMNKFVTYKSPNSESDQKTQPSMTFFTCENDDCKPKQRKQITTSAEMAHVYLGDEGYSDKERRSESLGTAQWALGQLQKNVEGSNALGFCCRTKGCPHLVWENNWVELHDVPTGPIGR